MKRRICAILCFFLLGAVLHVAVEWGFAVWSVCDPVGPVTKHASPVASHASPVASRASPVASHALPGIVDVKPVIWTQITIFFIGLFDSVEALPQAADRFWVRKPRFSRQRSVGPYPARSSA